MKVEVLLCTYRSVDPECFIEVLEGVALCNRRGMQATLQCYGSALVHVSRNRILAKIQPDTDYVVFVDDDMLPEREAIYRLLKHEAPVASAVCTTRVDPIYAVKVWNEERASFGQVDRAIKNPVCGPFGVGAAFLAVHMPVIEKLVEHYLSARDWLEDSRLMLDRMRVSAFRREEERRIKEKKRRAMYARDKYSRIFSHPVLDDEMECGEDIGFSRKLLQIGVPVLLDPTISVGHVGKYPYGPWDIDFDEKRPSLLVEPPPVTEDVLLDLVKQIGPQREQSCPALTHTPTGRERVGHFEHL